jgi:hypothetical protein
MKSACLFNEDPPMWVLSGGKVTSNYNWPPDINFRQIRSLSYCCPRCRAQVRRVPLEGAGKLTELLLCYCTAIFLRYDTPRPETVDDWQVIYDEWLEQHLRSCL